MRHFSLRLPSARTAGAFCALAAGMVLLNFALPQQEPAAFLLLWATFTVLRAYVAGTICYLGASAVFLSWQGTLCCLIQAAVLLLAFGICARLKFNPGEWRILFAAAAQIPFVFLFPHSGYALFPLPVLAQKAVIAVFFLLACVLTEGGVRAAMNASRCRLTGAELAEAALLWLLLGMGICTALGQLVYTGIAIFFVLLAAALFKNAVPVPLSIVLSLPLCVAQVSVSPLALFAVYACCALLVAPYGRIASALALLLAYLAAQYFAGVFSLSATEIVFSLLACVLPAAIVCSLPKKLLSRMQDSLLFYRERVLPRIAVNRNRRAVGERLYEVSALFREIESAFLLPEPEDDGDRRITAKVDATVCGACARAKTCPREKTMPALERLVRVGRAKGKANLIDLPADLAQNCPNVAGILFTLNKELESDSRRIAANETAREGRLLLARQAHGVSEIMRDLALKESEEYALSSGEDVLAKTLQEYGILSSEIFVYGEGGTLTVSMTLDETVPAKKACLAASEALGAPLALAEKLPLTSGRACYVFKRKPRFDAAFGIAACPKQGEAASGDTHSILKIDERRFLVALSDGMGSGDAARDVSSRTLSLMESFYKTGMPSDTVLPRPCRCQSGRRQCGHRQDRLARRLPPYGGRAENPGGTIPADGCTGCGTPRDHAHHHARKRLSRVPERRYHLSIRFVRGPLRLSRKPATAQPAVACRKRAHRRPRPFSQGRGRRRHDRYYRQTHCRRIGSPQRHFRLQPFPHTYQRLPTPHALFSAPTAEGLGKSIYDA